MHKPAATCLPVATGYGGCRMYVPMLSAMWRVFPSTVHATEAAGLEVGESLVDLLFGVHHERTVTDDRLVNRLTAEQQHHGLVTGFKYELVALALEQDQLPFAHRLQPIDLNRAT